MSEDDLAQLRARVEALESENAQMRQVDEVREVELRALQLEVALKAQYIERLERIEEEVVGPKDVHIRNLEAMIANLTASADRDPEQVPDTGAPTTRIPGLRKRRR